MEGPPDPGSATSSSSSTEAGRRRRRRAGPWSRHKKRLSAAAGAVALAAIGVVVPQLITGVEHAVAPTPSHPALFVQAITDLARFRSDAPHVPTFVIPRPMSAVGPPPNASASDFVDSHRPPSDSGPERYAWAHARGGVDADESLVRLSISGTSSAATVLHQLRARVLRCRHPLRGTLVSYTGQGSGLGVRYFLIDLDASGASVTYVDAHRHEKRQQPFPLRVTDAIQEEFDVMADTLRADCRWELLLDWTAGPRSGTEVIRDRGRPFRTTSAITVSGTQPGVTAFAWDPSQYRWVRIQH